MRGEQMAVEGKEPPRDTRRPRGLTSAERETGGTPRGEGGEQAKSEVDSKSPGPMRALRAAGEAAGGGLLVGSGKAPGRGAENI